MHIHPMTRVSATKEAEAVAMKLKHVCDSCSHIFPALRGPISTLYSPAAQPFVWRIVGQLECSCHSASRNERILSQMVDMMLFTNTENP